MPGSMVVGSDSHSNLYGALCCLGTPVVRTDAASIWATGVTWWQVPPVARVHLKGKLRPGVTGKDVIVTLCGLFNKDEVLNHAVEFVGDGVASLSIEQRMTIANMTTEWGALVGLFPFDEVTARLPVRPGGLLREGDRGPARGDRIRSATTLAAMSSSGGASAKRSNPDADADYAIELELDLDTVIPHVCGPNDVKTMASLPEIEPKQVEDQQGLADVVRQRALRRLGRGRRGRSRQEGRRRRRVLSRGRQRRSASESRSTTAIGKRSSTPGRSHCRPAAARASAWAAARSRPAKSASAPPIATSRAAWAIATDWSISARPPSSRPARSPAISRSPTKFADTKPRGIASQDLSEPAAQARVVAGDRRVSPHPSHGRLWFLDRDNLNTDGIYAGKHTYNDAMTPEQMAAVIFENYDPELPVAIAKPGDVIVGGYNFGTGSSREQAATALKYFGIPCVIAASFSETYKRNAFNNGFVVFECPELVEHLASDKRQADEVATLVGDDRRSTIRRATLTIRRQDVRIPAAVADGPGTGRRRRSGSGRGEASRKLTRARSTETRRNRFSISCFVTSFLQKPIELGDDRMAKYTIAWMPGDGIGNDVMDAARIVLDAMKLDAEYIPCDIGWEFWCKEGNALPDRTVKLPCRRRRAACSARSPASRRTRRQGTGAGAQGQEARRTSRRS